MLIVTSFVTVVFFLNRLEQSFLGTLRLVDHAKLRCLGRLLLTSNLLRVHESCILSLVLTEYLRQLRVVDLVSLLVGPNLLISSDTILVDRKRSELKDRIPVGVKLFCRIGCHL